MLEHDDRKMLKVLFVHNYYGSSAPSGENTVYCAERDLLRKYGHEVIEFTRKSDDIRIQGNIGLLKGALATPWNPFSATRLRRILEREQPDIMHVHNTFPLISPAIFHAASSYRTASVLTLHNYRCFCAAGIPERNAFPCTECLDTRSILPALRFGCYRDSLIATFPLAAMIFLHRSVGTWASKVDAFIALTEFQKNKLAGAGLPERKMHIKPHFYNVPASPLTLTEREARVVYIGRLGKYKGVHVLIDAWKKWGNDAPCLEIIGDGPERRNLEAHARGHSQISFTGQLDFQDVQSRLARSRLIVLPTLCFEGFPMVIREAFALGVPVAGSRLGSIPCIVDDERTGVLFKPGDPDDLHTKVKTLWKDECRMRKISKAARAEFESKYTVAANYPLLMKVYESAIERRFRRWEADSEKHQN